MIDITGQVFGRWTVTSRAPNSAKGQARWNCRCACGAEATVDSVSIRSGHSRSCGCLSVETVVARSTKHGHSPMRSRPTSTYQAWAGMVARCTNPNNKAFVNYGGRGITVCDQWLDFASFLADMGERPANTSLDRIENSRCYEPGNCRWATAGQQARNKRNNRPMTLNGETMLMCEWTERLGLRAGLLAQRIHYGWSDELALTTPVRGWGPGRPRAA